MDHLEHVDTPNHFYASNLLNPLVLSMDFSLKHAANPLGVIFVEGSTFSVPSGF